MYLIGAEHPNRAWTRQTLEGLVRAGTAIVTDVEVFQEILHRYVAIDRRDAIEPAFEVLLRVVDEVLSIDLVDVERAKSLALLYSTLSARDCLHAAVMERHGVDRILTFDRGFDRVPGIERVPRDA